MSEPERLVPLRPVILEILLLLHEGPVHGYGIMKQLGEKPAGRWVLGPGTLYRTLAEMRTLGLIETDENADEHPRRRYYRLTSFGGRVLGAEVRRMESLVARARSGPLLRSLE